MAQGKKKFVKAVEVKTIQVPHFEGLNLERMLGHARKHPTFNNYLPAEEREIEKLPRAYVSNLIYTIVGDKFRKWVQGKIQERTEAIMAKQDMAIEMDPEVFKAFKSSNTISGKYLTPLLTQLSF